MNEELIQALMQSYGMDPQMAQMFGRNAQAEMSLAPLQEEMLKVNTFSRPSGHAGNILEGVVDAFRRPKVEGRHNEALMEALGSRYGMDQLQAQMEAMQRQREEEETAGLYQQVPGVSGPAEAKLRSRGMDIPKQEDSRTTLIKNAEAMGLKPGTPEFNEYVRQASARGGVTVNTGDQGPKVGTIPPGFQLVKDQSGAYRMEQIPGSPAEQEAAALEDKEVGRTAQTRRAGTTVVQDLGRALQLIPKISQGEGVVGANLRLAKSGIAGTPEYQVLQFKESALSNVGLDTLQQIRENSPTGGGLGQVPIQQQKRLEQVLGSLEIGQPPEVTDANMKRIMNIYTDIMYGSPEERAIAVQQGKMTPEESAEIDQRYFELPFDEMGRPIDNSQGVAPPPPGFELD